MKLEFNGGVLALKYFPLFWIGLAQSVGIQPAVASVRLELPYFKQERPLSCEAASLRMVLKFYGFELTEAEVLEKMPRDPTPKSDGVWGDPDLGFVGDIDGAMGETGYGIHWKGLARVASNWKKAVVLERGTVARLVHELDHQRPVIAWGIAGPFRKLTWKTPAGRTVSAMDSEHTRVVFGYEGNGKAPTGFYIMDPQKGPSLWKTQDFLRDWDSFGRKALVLYR